MKNKIEDLRNHLFETIEMLKDDDKPMEIDRAKAVSQVAQTIIESAKVELKHMELTGSDGSDFIGHDADPLPRPVRRLTAAGN